MIESEIKEFANLIAKWRSAKTMTAGENCVFKDCALDLENVLNILAPPVEPSDCYDKMKMDDEDGYASSPPSMLDPYDGTCPECGQKVRE